MNIENSNTPIFPERPLSALYPDEATHGNEESAQVCAETSIRPGNHGVEEISFHWIPGQRLVELVHRAGGKTQFAIWEHGAVRYDDKIESFRPLSGLDQYIRHRAIRVPSRAAGACTTDEFAAKVRTFIHKYFDCNPVFESVAVLYALHTWVYEKFHAVAYLRFLCLSGSGKTRATETIGAACYRPLVLAGSLTPAPMFRLVEAVGGTMLIDEADFKDSLIGSEIVKVLNCGYQKGLPVSRMEKNESGGLGL